LTVKGFRVRIKGRVLKARRGIDGRKQMSFEKRVAKGFRESFKLRGGKRGEKA